MDERLKKFNKASKRTGLLLVGVVLLFFVSVVYFVQDNPLFGAISLVLSISSLALYVGFEKRLNDRFRKTYVKDEVKAYFSNYLTSSVDMGQYIVERDQVVEEALTVDDFKAARFAEVEVKKLKAYDVLKGSMASVPFTSSDVFVKGVVQRRPNQSTYTTVFAGRFAKFTFPKAFLGEVKLGVTSMNKIHPRLQKLMENTYKRGLETGDDLSKIDVQFSSGNASLNVYASDLAFGEAFFNETVLKQLETLVETHHVSLMMRVKEDALYLGIKPGVRSGSADALTFQLPMAKALQESSIKNVKAVVETLYHMIEAVQEQDSLFKS